MPLALYEPRTPGRSVLADCRSCEYCAAFNRFDADIPLSAYCIATTSRFDATVQGGHADGLFCEYCTSFSRFDADVTLSIPYGDQ